MADGLVLTRRMSERGVHETAQRAGAGAASALVRHYVGYEEWPDSGFARREVARRGVALILGFGDPIDVYANGDEGRKSTPRSLAAFVVGNQSGWSMTGVGGHQLGVQIELTPAGARALFGGDVSHLNDAALPLDEVLGQSVCRMLDRLAASSTWPDRLDVLDQELAAACSGNGSASDVVLALPPEVSWLRRQLEDSQGRMRVEPLMDETGWSRRHMTERFRSALGVSPKTYARLCRFEHAVFLLDRIPDGTGPARTLADVAIAAGYYDQSHLTRDFVTLAGVTPGTYMAEASAVPESGLSNTPPVRVRHSEGMTITNDTANDRTSEKTNDMTDHTTNESTRSGIVPVLVYEDIEAGHDYLVRTFGFTSGGLHRIDDGSVVHGEVRMGKCAIWLHRVAPESEMASPRDAAASHGGLSVLVDDVDAHYARSVAAGARIDSEPKDQDYGLREYGARDPENHRFWFSTPIA
jgi:AraC-like DNA-binding protein/uncharacterized glyoxalase superfamily protein PhnB